MSEARTKEWQIEQLVDSDGNKITKDQFVQFVGECWDKTPEDERTDPLVIMDLTSARAVCLFGCGPDSAKNATAIVNAADALEAKDREIAELKAELKDAYSVSREENEWSV